MNHAEKRILLSGALALALFLSGCAGKKEQPSPAAQATAEEEMVETETEYVPERPIWQVMGSDVQVWAEQFDPEKVDVLTYSILGESREEFTILDSERILSFFDAINQITVAERAEGYAADAGDVFCFTMKDGEEVTIEFCLSCVVTDRVLYETQNAEALWDLTGTLIEEPEQTGGEIPAHQETGQN